MPIYEFQCDACGIQDEKFYQRISAAPDEVPCEECGSPMRKLFSETNHSFAHTVEGGPRPQNTGVHGIDYNVDQVIGRDAAERWKGIGVRNDEKDRVVMDERKAGKAVTREHLVPVGDSKGHETGFRVIQEAERKAANKARTIAAEATSSPPGK